MGEENTVKTNDKKNIIIVILITIIICLLLFICYDKMFKNEVKEKNTEKENTQEETKDNEENNEDTKEITTSELNLLTEKTNSYVNYYDLQETIPLTNISSIDNQILLNYVIGKLEWAETFSAQEVENVIKDFIGIGYTLEHQDIKCNLDEDQPLYTYDSNKKTYTQNPYHDGHGGNSRGTYTKYIDSYKSNNNYVLNFKIIYSNPISDEGIPYKYYKNINDSNNDENVIYEFNFADYDFVEMNDEIFKTFEEQIPTTTFTYEKNSDGTFNLKSITVK